MRLSIRFGFAVRTILTLGSLVSLFGAVAASADMELSMSSDPVNGTWSSIAPPYGRTGHATVYDPVRNRMLFVGGDGNAVSDTWELRLAPTPQWSFVETQGAAPAGRSGHSLIYDPVRDRLVLFGGKRQVGSTSLNDLWVLHLDETPPRWEQLAPGGIPPEVRSGHTTVYDSVSDRMIVFAGFQVQSPYNLIFNDVWALSLGSDPSWTQLSPGGTAPPVREDHVAVIDSRRHRMLVFGGYQPINYDQYWLNDVWALSLGGAGSWQELSPVGPVPVQRQGHAATYDEVQDRLVVFGGYYYEQSTWTHHYLQDTWTLALSDTLQWQMIQTEESPPAARQNHTAIADGNREMLVFGGNAGPADTRPFADVWALSLDGQPAWTERSPLVAAPPGRYNTAAAYDTLRDEVVVFGGWGHSTELNDLWVLSFIGSPSWTELQPAGELPSPRNGATLTYDPVGQRMFLFGGESAQQKLNDTWMLEFTPDLHWTQLEPLGELPVPRARHTAIFDPIRNRLIVVGGWTGDVNSYPDTWALDLAGPPQWSRIANGPTVFDHSAMYDAERDRVVIFGGAWSWERFRVASYLSLGAPAGWQPLTPEGGAESGDGASCVLDPVRDRLVVFGGFYSGTGFVPCVQAHNMTPGSGWVDLTPTGGAFPERAYHAAVYDSRRERMVLFGGWGPRYDTWFLTWGVLPPAAPSNVSALLLCPPHAQVSWHDDSENEEGFEIQERLGSAGDWESAAQVEASVTSWTSPALPSGEICSFRIRSYSGDAYSEWSPEANVAVPAVLRAPVGVTAEVLRDCSGIRVTWNPVPDAAGYSVSRISGGPPKTWSVPSLSISTIDSDVTDATEYSYVVSAKNACGVTGPQSDQARAKFYYPVIFAHGICQGPGAWDAWAQMFTTLGLTRQERADFCRPEANNPRSPMMANGPIEDAANQLHFAVLASGAVKVNIVAYSMGGVIARYWIEQGHHEDMLNKLVLIGSPNHGAGANKTWLRWPGELIGSLGWTFVRCLSMGEAAAEMKVNSEFMRQLNYHQIHGVNDEQCPGDRGNGGPEALGTLADHYWTIAGTGSETGLICTSVQERTGSESDCGWSRKSSDGFVSVGSVHLDALADDHNLIDFSLVGSHLYHSTPLSLSGRPLTCSESYLESYPLAIQVAHLLKGEPFEPISAFREDGAPHLTTPTMDESPLTDLGYLSIKQAAGSVVETSFPVPACSEAAFFCEASESTGVALRLRRPDGSVLCPSDTSAFPTVTFRSEPENRMTFFVIDNPAPGEWRVVTDAGGTPDSVVCNLVVQLRSAETMSVVLDSLDTDLGRRLRLRAVPASSGAVADADIEGILTRPDGTEEPAVLLDDGMHEDGAAGDGTFGASLDGSAQGGLYAGRVVGRWTSGGVTVTRAGADVALLCALVDLAIDSVSVETPSPIELGEIVTLAAHVRNLGSLDAVAAKIIWVQAGVGQIGNTDIGVAAGGTVIVRFSWNASGNDKVTIAATALLLTGATELRADNNAASVGVLVTAPVTGTQDALLAPKLFAFRRVTPNPFRRSVTFDFELPEQASVFLDVFDISGRRVARIISGIRYPAGRYSIRWERDLETSGVYFARFTAGKYQSTRKIICLR